ncbi:MAG TPA: MarR family transcriptional regulator [Steroidobacteraceae bacterium]|nr:MarR family transcriptional regulator [Steroidobacteraceae bacterium]
MGDIYEIESYEPRSGAGHLLGKVRVAMLAALDREFAADPELAKLEVTSAQFAVLSWLCLYGARSASDLCRSISYDAGAMTRMVDRLESKGLVRRSRSADDRRLVHIELTDAGNTAFPPMRAVAVRVLNRFLRGFSKSEARQLESFLTRMLENAHAEV